MCAGTDIYAENSESRLRPVSAPSCYSTKTELSLAESGAKYHFFFEIP